MWSRHNIKMSLVSRCKLKSVWAGGGGGLTSRQRLAAGVSGQAISQNRAKPSVPNEPLRWCVLPPNGGQWDLPTSHEIDFSSRCRIVLENKFESYWIHIVELNNIQISDWAFFMLYLRIGDWQCFIFFSNFTKMSNLALQSQSKR